MSEEQKVESVEETEVVQEATSGQASLKPNARSSKSEMLSAMMRVVGGMKKDDLSAFLTKTLDQVGKEDESVPANAGKNQASIAQSGTSAPSPTTGGATVKEDIEDLFSDQEDLSEDFKTRASTLFEAAVNNRVVVETARIEEEYEQKLEEQVSESIEELHSHVNQYMDYVVEKWMEENALAIESNYRTESTEKFIESLKGLFVEHYVDVPEEKLDMLGELEEEVQTLSAALEESEAKRVQLEKNIDEAIQSATFDDVSEGLTDTQVEKLRALAEGVEFSSQEEYGKKLTMIRDQYFAESKAETQSTGLITEEATIGSNDEPESEFRVPEEMKSYFNAISNTVRK